MKNELLSSDPRVESGLAFSVLYTTAETLVDSVDPVAVADFLTTGALAWETRSSGALALNYTEGSDASGYQVYCVASISPAGRVALYA